MHHTSLKGFKLFIHLTTSHVFSNILKLVCIYVAAWANKVFSEEFILILKFSHRREDEMDKNCTFLHRLALLWVSVATNLCAIFRY